MTKQAENQGYNIWGGLLQVHWPGLKGKNFHNIVKFFIDFNFLKLYEKNICNYNFIIFI